jgi:lipopolysaccharide transport system ATP-binding protein
MSDIAIRVDNLSKLYKIGALRSKHDTLRDRINDVLFNPFKKLAKVAKAQRNPIKQSTSFSTDDHIWALKDVSFEVKRGEVIGIIGRNGAGKTTLLKILSRITEPTKGRAEILGRVGSLLEVGTGFHPELTGRENIYLNGAILGMKKNEIERKFDEIVAFAEIERFLDTPVKRYSSGMYVRLAFAVAAHLDPEILLVDEVLAVGDVSFQKKCLGKMDDVAKQGRTVLFVSHNLAAIQSLCQRAILLNSGTLILDGSAKSVISKYLTTGLKQEGECVWTNIDQAPGDDIVKLGAIRVLNKDKKVCTQFDVRDPIYFEMEYWVLRDIDYLDVSFYLKNERGELIFASRDNSMDMPNGDCKRRKGYYCSGCNIPEDLLNDGQIYVQVNLTGISTIHTIQRDIITFYVEDSKQSNGAQGNYKGQWPYAAVRPKLEWSTNCFPIEQHM